MAAQREKMRKANTGDKLEVSHFADEIYLKVQKSAPLNHNHLRILEFVAYASRDGIGDYLTRNLSKIKRRLIGCFSGITGRVIYFLSTHSFARYMDDQRFKDYGFGPYSYETNQLLPPSNT